MWIVGGIVACACRCIRGVGSNILGRTLAFGAFALETRDRSICIFYARRWRILHDNQGMTAKAMALLQGA